MRCKLCKKHASFNFKGEKGGKYCADHKQPDMFNVIHKTCSYDSCDKRPHFNFKGKKQGKFCAVHKEPDMVDVKNKTCEVDDCDKIPTFNFKGEKGGKFCFDHKQPDMVNVKDKTCSEDGCDKRPNFNFKGKKQGKFCSDHKQPDMVNVISKTCEEDGCDKQPIFNFKGEKGGKYCSDHKQPDMVNVRDKTCSEVGCDKIPNFNFKGEKQGKYCSVHKQPYMVDVKNKICSEDGCDKKPNFNFKGEKLGKYCFDHKESGMVDVKHKTCEEDSCDKQVSYGLLGQGKTHCAQHRLKDMITQPNRKCISCEELGCFEYQNFRYCEEHKPDVSDVFNLGLYKCISCGLLGVLINNKCETCDPDVIKKRTKAKENRIRDIFISLKIPFVQDRILESSSCGRERPDFVIDCGSHLVIFEVDENQHSSYACECEQTRMINIAQAAGMPVTYIRYNPDIYQPHGKQKMQTNEQREKRMLEYLKFSMKNSPTDKGDFANVLYLFYDDHDNTKPAWFSLIKL
jgi:hypothetical protein